MSRFIRLPYSWDYPNAPDRHRIQYFEMFGNRGIYFDGWSLYAKDSTPVFVYNHLGIDRHTATTSAKVEKASRR